MFFFWSSCTHYVHVSGGTGITPLQVVTNQLISEAKRGRAIDCLWWGAAACAGRVPHLSALLCSSAAQTGALEPVGWHAAGAARRCVRGRLWDRARGVGYVGGGWWVLWRRRRWRRRSSTRGRMKSGSLLKSRRVVNVSTSIHPSHWGPLYY